MSNRVVLEPIFVLHSRAYSNTSLIVECLTMRYGKVSMMARSARGLKSRYQGKLQCFVPMLASWSGARELKNLGTVELCSTPYHFNSRVLMCAFYLNELLVRLLQRDDPCPQVFTLYQMTLNALEKGELLQQALRCFEKKLLELIGYGLSLTHDSASGAPVEPECYYQYYPEYGLVKLDDNDGGIYTFSGASLLALDCDKLYAKQELSDSKRLMRLVISKYIGQKPLKTREIMV